MYRVRSTSLDFGKTSKEPIDYLAQNDCEYESVKVDPNSSEDAVKVLKDTDVLIVGLQQIGAEVLKAANRLKVIGRCGAGLDNIDLKAAGEMGVPVVFTPGTNAETVADFAMGLMLALTRQIPLIDRTIKKGEWKRVVTHDMWSKTLGLFGLGQIGLKVAQRARGFEMKVLAFDLFENQKATELYGVKYASKETILEEADFVSIHLPLTDKTRAFISVGELSRMKRSAFLVNTSRGGIVDEKALYSALKQGEIAGAALDVFEKEPPGKNPLLELDNFVASPHLGGITEEAISRIGMTVARDVVSVLRGEEPKFLANGEFLRKKTET